MNRKTIILCASVLVVFAIIVAVALSVLYSGAGKGKNSLASDREYALLSAIPSDAVLFFKFENLETAVDAVCSPNSSLHFFSGKNSADNKFVSFLGSLSSETCLSSSECAISVHYVGDLMPLLVIDASKAEEKPVEDAARLLQMAKDSGLYAEYLDVSQIADEKNMLRKRSLVLVSPSDVLIKSSERHIKRDESVLSSSGVSESLTKASGDNMMVIPNANVRKIISSFVNPAYRADADFLAKFSDCVAFNIDSYNKEHLSFAGKSFAQEGPRCFQNIYESVEPSRSKLSAVLPSYTIFAATIPFSDVSSYEKAYLKFAETLSLSKDIEAQRAAIKKKCGIDPILWARTLDLKEVSISLLKVGDKLEKILYLRPGIQDNNIIFKGLDSASIKSYDGSMFKFKYSGMASLLFGSLFSAADETSCIFVEGWIIAGSKNALTEYVSGRALEYRLRDYLADAQVEDRISSKDTYFASYFSVAEEDKVSDDLFKSHFSSSVKQSAKGISFEPVFLTLVDGKEGIDVRFDVERKIVMKSQAPVFERDTVVVVPCGPFKVKNSGTGKMNLFYQQDNMYLCLQEESGKGIWGVPFKSPICGCARTVDYFANGKLQILFGSGSKLYLIDRLGRFVNPFPVELGKEILIGPDVYDFAGKKKYNVMVLHSDNTIDMYNLQGKKPAQWKGIRPSDTIKGLPERIFVGQSSYWVVRTSIRTLIYPFYGGEPLTQGKEEKMIRPDSKVVTVDNDKVEVTCYDGKKHQIRLK